MDNSLQITSEQPEPCTVVLDITVDEQHVSRIFDSVYREFSKYVSVPGFRPGKAPRPLVERQANKEKVRERALEKLLNDTFPKALEAEGLTPYRNPEVQPPDIEDKKPYTYKALVPLEPQVVIGEYTGITVEKPVFPLKEEMVEQRLTQLREGRARLERVADRGIEPGDVVIAENKVVLEGEEDDTPPRRQLIQLGNNIPGFDEAILGMMPGEERVFELTFPEDYDEEEKRGKKATHTVKVSSISAKKLPELDAEFTQQIAGVDSVEELRDLIRQRLETEVVQLSDQIAEQRIIQHIVENAQIAYPAMLVRDDIQEEFRRLGKELQESQTSYEDYLASIGKTAEEHQQELSVMADQRIRAILALREISINEGLQATDENIDGEFDRLLESGVLTDNQYQEFKTDGRRRLQVANALVQQRLHDFLFANNDLQEVVQETPPDPEELAEAGAETE